MQMDSAPQDPIFLGQYNEAINFAQNKDQISLVQKNIDSKILGNP